MAGLHQVQRVHRQHARANADPARGHDFGDAGVAHIDTGIEDAAQIAIGEDADNVHLVIADGRHAQIFTRDFQQRIAQGGLQADVRDLIAGMHNIIDPQQQLTTECAAGVRQGKIFSGKAAGFEQRYGEGVAHDQRRGGAGGRRQPQRAGLFRDFHAQMDIGGARHAAVRAAGNADKRYLLAFKYRDKRQYFV